MNVLMKKILIVEDQGEVLKLLEIVLRAEDRKIWLTESGEEALEIAQKVFPDVILLDIMLPGRIDGHGVAEAIKKDPKTADCSIIVMTAMTQKQDIQKALEAGADDFIAKPFNLENIKSKIAKCLE